MRATVPTAADRLAAYLKRSGRSQAELADAVSCSEARISQLIAGDGRPKPELAAAIAAETFGAVPVAAWYELVRTRSRRAAR